MIHIIISVQTKPLTVVLHQFETRNTSKDEHKIGHILRTLLQPFLRKVAQGENARFRIIE